MFEYIQSPEFQQLLADNPNILIGVAAWVSFTLIVSLLCLSRWFSVTIVHNYPASTVSRERPRNENSRQRKPPVAPNPTVFNEWLKQNFPDAAVESPDDEPAVGATTRSKLATSKRFAILRRDSFRCRICGLRATDDENLVLHVDHRLPLAAGGTDDDDNLWTLCDSCNLGKSDLVVSELLPDAIRDNLDD